MRRNDHLSHPSRRTSSPPCRSPFHGATLGLLLAVVAVVVSACSSDQTASVPTLELTTTTAPATTTAPTTEPSTTSTTVDPRIAEVEAAVDRFRQVLESVRTAAGPIEDLADVASGGVLESTQSYYRAARAEGRTSDGEFIRSIVDTQLLSAERATVLECGLDGIAAFDSAGNEVIPADMQPLLRRYSLELQSGQWKVTEIKFELGTRTSCDL